MFPTSRSRGLPWASALQYFWISARRRLGVARLVAGGLDWFLQSLD